MARFTKLTLSAQTPAPILVTDIARVIHAIKGQIWQIQKYDFGLQLRAAIGGRNVRIVLPSLTSSAAEVPVEANSAMHVVLNMDDFSTWLSRFSSIKNG